MVDIHKAESNGESGGRIQDLLTTIAEQQKKDF